MKTKDLRIGETYRTRRHGIVVVLDTDGLWASRSRYSREPGLRLGTVKQPGTVVVAKRGWSQMGGEYPWYPEVIKAQQIECTVEDGKVKDAADRAARQAAAKRAAEVAEVVKTREAEIAEALGVDAKCVRIRHGEIHLNMEATRALRRVLGTED